MNGQLPDRAVHWGFQRLQPVLLGRLDKLLLLALGLLLILGEFVAAFLPEFRSGLLPLFLQRSDTRSGLGQTPLLHLQFLLMLNEILLG